MEGNFLKGFEKGILKMVEGEKWDFEGWYCSEIEKYWEKRKNIEERKKPAPGKEGAGFRMLSSTALFV